MKSGRITITRRHTGRFYIGLPKDDALALLSILAANKLEEPPFDLEDDLFFSLTRIRIAARSWANDYLAKHKAKHQEPDNEQTVPNIPQT